MSFILKSSNQTVGKDYFSLVFEFLCPEELAQVSFVGKQWHELALDERIWSIFQENLSELTVIDGAVWKEYINLEDHKLSISDEPSVNSRAVISFLYKFGKEIEGNGGATLLTLPKGLCLNTLLQLARAPKKGHAAACRDIWIDAAFHLQAISTEKTNVVLISNNVLKGSRKLSATAQKELASDVGCKIPSVLEATALAVMSYITSNSEPPTRLFGDQPITYTRCKEEVRAYSVIVGNFSQGGFVIDGKSLASECYGACASVNL